MEQKNLAKWLKLILIGIGICGLIVYAVIIPMYGMSLKSLYPEFANRYWTWLIFLWISSIPCFAVLYFAWKISTNIGKDQTFTRKNAFSLKKIAIISASDAGYFFIGNLILLFSNMSHPSVMIASLGVVFLGVAVSVVSAVLSYLVKKAAILQEQSDLTI